MKINLTEKDKNELNSLKIDEAIKHKYLINVSAVKKYILKTAKDLRMHTFTRVSKKSLDHIDYRVRQIIQQEILKLPSAGKTIKF